MNSLIQPLRPARLLKNKSICRSCRKELQRAASTAAAIKEDDLDLETSSFDVFPPSEQDAQHFDPLKPSRERKIPLPPSRYGRGPVQSSFKTDQYDIDINIVLQSTIAVLLRRIDHHLLTILPLENLSLDHSLSHDLRRSTTTPSLQIS